MKKRRVKLFVDGEVLVLSHFSGIGHYTADLMRSIDKLLNQEEYSHFSVSIGVTFRLKHKLAKYKFENIAVKGMPLPIRVVNGLKQRHWLPPIDFLFGKKVYLFPNYSSWPILRGKSIPIVYDLSFVNHPEFVDPQNQVFLVDQVTRSVKSADRIVTISKNSKSEIVDHYKVDANKVDIVYPAVDLHNFYRRSLTEINYVKAKYGIFGNYFLFVGNIEPRKNLITLLHAYNRLSKEQQHQYSLLLVGAKGWLDDGIRDTILEMRLRGLHVIQPTEYVSDNDLPALYSGAKAFIYVSKYEGFGIPPIEAMACGTPVITSNNSSLPEAVGNAAIMIDANDDKQLADGLNDLLNDSSKTKNMILAGYQQVNNFDLAESAKVLLASVEKAS